jgi:transcriptional regulator with PAS, ATPase and Fis domain
MGEEPGVRGERDTLVPSGAWVARPASGDVGAGRRIELVVLAGPDQGRRVVRDSLPISIGSGCDRDLRLTDPYVSRAHCTLAEAQDGSPLLRDEGSRNGTFVNGVRVFQAAFVPGAEVQVGRSRIRFGVHDEEACTAPRTIERFGDLVGAAPSMQAAFDALRRIAHTSLTCLLLGETGTGKELAARGIHAQSRRAGGPFIVIDCGAISEALVEDKLFGHERGAFTGASKEAAGAFEEASGGTIFLDEIGELPLSLQPKLLRVLERREIVRLGAHGTVPVDVRLVAATHRDLEERAAAGEFRQDLYYRLAETAVCLPALRNRVEDVEPLARLLLDQAGGGHLALAPEAVALLERYTWPGNVRELRNVVRRAAAYASAGLIDDAAIERAWSGSQRLSFVSDAPEPTQTFSTLPIAEARDAHRREYLKMLLEHHGDDHAAIASHMGVHIKYARRLMRKHRLIP